MSNPEPILWEQLSAEERTRILAILVQMLLHIWTASVEGEHEPAAG
jgi:hypothetical protein